MIKAKTSVSACACIPHDETTHLEKTSSMLAMSSNFRSQYCFLKVRTDFQYKADEYDALDTSLSKLRLGYTLGNNRSKICTYHQVEAERKVPSCP